MTRARRIAVAGAAAVALAGIGLGVAGGVDDDRASRRPARRPSGRGRRRPRSCPAGPSRGLERDEDGGAAWEAEVRRPDGTVVEVHLRDDLRPAGPAVAEEGDD